MPTAEHEVFGANHADVAGYLIGLWGLPVPVVEAVALHHTPSRALQPVFSPLTSVHLANVLDWDQLSIGGGVLAPTLDAPYLERVGVSPNLDVWRKALAPQD